MVVRVLSVMLMLIPLGCMFGCGEASQAPHMDSLRGNQTAGAGPVGRHAPLKVTDEGARSRRRGRPVQWRVLAPPRGRKIEIGNFVPWCASAGRPKPRIEEVLEADDGGRVVLTAYLAQRAYGQCAAVETLVGRTVVLGKRVGGRKIYDGSVHPAARRWPR